MVKVDLITGFLGSGKTTFIKKYAEYLMSCGSHICILENDYGAVNVDMMLLQNLEGEQCELEMVAGGCDADCHRRRFKTKLIAMGMCGYDRVLIEPSGIFDVDEFFDVLDEEHGYSSLYFMNIPKTMEKLRITVERLLGDTACGNIVRVKGFMQTEDGSWMELNATHHEIAIQPIEKGQEVFIVIGENLNKDRINEYWTEN